MLDDLRARFASEGAFVAGILSGTSADGIDVAITRMRARENDVGPPVLIAFATLPFPDEVRARVRRVLDGEACGLRDAALLSRDLGRAFGRAARELAEQHDVALDLAGSHGQTVWHHDGNETSGAATLQFGDGDFVAEEARCTVVSDFRQRDIAAGGEGAPISALADDVIFARVPRPCAILNLGGMGNLTVLYALESRAARLEPERGGHVRSRPDPDERMRVKREPGDRVRREPDLDERVEQGLDERAGVDPDLDEPKREDPKHDEPARQDFSARSRPAARSESSARSSGPSDVLAFDTGPANSLLDGLARRLLHAPRDEDGAAAARGRVDEAFVKELARHPFFDKPPPRSTGRDTFGESWVGDVIDRARARGLLARGPDDLIATATAFVAQTVADSLSRWVEPRAKRLVVAGGGVHNRSLMLSLYERCLVPVGSSSAAGVDPDAREALVFAVLAARCILGRPVTRSGATGARAGRLLGKISPA